MSLVLSQGSEGVAMVFFSCLELKSKSLITLCVREAGWLDGEKLGDIGFLVDGWRTTREGVIDPES